MLGVEDLRLIRAVVTTGTLTGAAASLRVDHSTAFRRLGAVEARLGVRLFERARDGYVPTEAGEAAAATAEHVLAEMAALDLRIAGRDLRPTGTVRLTMPDTMVAALAPMLAAFRVRHPGIVVELVVSNAHLALTRRDADVALRPAAEVPETLVGRRVAMIATAVYAAAAGGDAEGDDAAWIGLDEALAHTVAARWLAGNVAPARIVARCDSLLAAAALARAGIGRALLPCLVGDADPALRRVLPPIPEAAIPLWILTHPDLRGTARIRALTGFLAERLTGVFARLSAGDQPAQSR